MDTGRVLPTVCEERSPRTLVAVVKSLRKEIHARGRGAVAGLLVVLAAGLATGSSPARAAGQCGAWMNQHRSPSERAHSLLHAMDLSDKINMVTGSTGNPTVSYPNYGSAGVVSALPALCVPALVLNDAAAGIGDTQILTTAFPDGVTQAATWDPRLLRELGNVLGAEAFAKGVNVLLGPGANILRDPLNGRGWEYYGEDPYLTGQSVAAIIRGIQENPVVATVKHYLADDQEGTSNNNFGTVSNNVASRTMHEIELPPFEAAVRAGVGAAMCTSEQVNGVYACQDRKYLTQVLGRQFRFPGWVMSDWQAAQSTVASANAGLDMEMPSAQYYGPALQAAVEHGLVSLPTLNGMVYRILVTMFRFGLFDHVPHEGSQAFATNASTQRSTALALQVAEEGTVLLKNAHHVLPLSGPAKRIAVIGSPASPSGATLAEQGYGSGHVPEPGYPVGVVSPLQAIAARAATAGDLVTYTDGSATQEAVLAARAADVPVVFVSDVSSEGFDRPDLTPRAGTCDPVNQTGCTYSSLDQNALVSAVAAANPNTVVVLQNGGPLVMPWLDEVKGVIENWYPGQVDGNAITPILFGDVNPSGHLPETFPRALADGPLRTPAQYPGVNGQVSHSENLLVGYRWYTARHIAPMFPFGFGLSYTTFRFSGLSVTQTASGATVSVTVSNTGTRSGADIAQVYVGDPRVANEPPAQLEGYQRVALGAGQRVRVRIALSQRSFAHWSPAAGRWAVSPGCYTIMVGDSSASATLQASLVRGKARRSCRAARRRPAR
jgi:beta-glucosidase